MSGSWDNPNHWTPSGVPSGTDNVCITVAGSYTVYAPGSKTVASLSLGTTTGEQSLRVQGNNVVGTATMTATGSITIAGKGTLTLESGAGFQRTSPPPP